MLDPMCGESGESGVGGGQFAAVGSWQSFRWRDDDGKEMIWVK
jgi:hypothetical protein